MPKERTRETRVQDFVAEHGMDLFMEEGELPAWERFAAAILEAHVAKGGVVSIGDVALISGGADFMVAARRRHVYELRARNAKVLEKSS